MSTTDDTRGQIGQPRQLVEPRRITAVDLPEYTGSERENLTNLFRRIAFLQYRIATATKTEPTSYFQTERQALFWVLTLAVGPETMAHLLSELQVSADGWKMPLPPGGQLGR